MNFSKAIKFALVSLFIFLLCSCSESSDNSENGKLKVVTTLFPQYDFAESIGGDTVQVIKLLPWGTESHSYDMSIADMTRISDADIFLYTGKNMESWAESILESADNKNMLIVDLSENITLLRADDGNSHTDHTQNTNSHNHDYDSHIWTSPENALIMVDDILYAFCEKDAQNAQYYTTNAEKLKQEILALSEKLETLSESYDGRTLYFGGRFAFLYMFRHYGFNYKSPYLGCGEHSEPGIKTVTEIISQMKADGAKYIFFEEMSDGKVAKSIASETGAELLLLHSCHNLSADDAQKGKTYVSVMEENIENLEIAMANK